MRRRAGARIARRLGCLLSVAVPGLALAQTAVRTGGRVRITHDDTCCPSPQVGRLVSVSTDSVVVLARRKPADERVAVPRAAVRALEQGHEVGTYAWRGGGIGALTGFVIGAGAVIATTHCGDDEICGSFEPALVAGAGGLGALLGLFVGTAIGGATHRVVWEPVLIPARLGVGSQGRGSVVRIMLAF